MRVLVCHVHYLQTGGEDLVFDTEVSLLRSAGIDVRTLEASSADFWALTPVGRARLALTYGDHSHGRVLMREALREHRPDVVHLHNVFPMLGPGAIAEAATVGRPTVQTLHNYRLSCLTGRYVRDGRLCTDCRPCRFAPGVAHACYRGSRVQSLITARATARQWRQFTAGSAPDLYLTLTPFMARIYTAFGASEQRIVVKPNSVEAGQPRPIDSRAGVFCAGRLSPEKGIVQLMRAWPPDAQQLTVAGDGPMRAAARQAVRHNVRYVGKLSPSDVRAALRTARVLVLPSLWPEGLPLVLLEAFADGTPVVTFDAGSSGEAVRELSRRCLAPYASMASLAACARRTAEDGAWRELSARCVGVWHERYSPDRNLRALLDVYERLTHRRATAPV